MFKLDLANKIKLKRYRNRTPIMRFLSVLLTFVLISLILPYVILTGLFSKKPHFRSWYYFIVRGYNDDVEDYTDIVATLFGATYMLVYVMSAMLSIIGAFSYVKNPMYIEYNKEGQITRLIEFKYPEGYSYSYCYYTPDVYIAFYDLCWFRPGKSEYKVLAEADDKIAYYDSNRVLRTDELSKMDPADIIRHYKKPIPKKIDNSKQINF